MPKILSFILNHKKTLLFVFLSAVIFSVVATHPVLAEDRSSALLHMIPDQTSGIHWDLTQLWQGIAVSESSMFNFGAFRFAALMNVLLSYVITTFMQAKITTDGVFIQVWGSVRDLANMGIVIGFIIIGIATALRVQEYSAKKILWRLILVAVVVNFSGVFCGLLIDAGNILTTGLGSSGGGNMGTALMLKLWDGSFKLLDVTLAQTDWPNFVAYSAMYGLIFLGTAVTFFYLSVLLIARYVILAILFMISPLAFVFWVFPASRVKKYQSEWWEHFVKWNFVGVFASVVLFIAGAVMSRSMADAANPNDVIVRGIVVLGFLFVGFKMTSQKTGLASSATKMALGLATGGAALAMGAVGGGAAGLLTGGAKIANRLSGGKGAQAIQAVKQTYGNTLEQFGLRDKGATNIMTHERMDGVNKRIGSLAEDEKTKIANGTGRFVNANEKAAAIQDKVKNGKLSDLGDTAKQASAVAFAENHLKSKGLATNIRSDAVNQNYKLAGEDTEKVQKLADAQHIIPPEAKNRLIETKLDELMPGMSHSKLREIEPSQLTHDRMSRLGADKLSAFRTGSREQIDQIQGPDVRGKMDTQLRQLEADKFWGKRIDESKFTRLKDQIKEIDSF